jgi:hypothetical protein
MQVNEDSGSAERRFQFQATMFQKGVEQYLAYKARVRR